MELHLTADELVETLKRSSLTTVIVEGKEDMMIYRWIEDKIGVNKANFLPCGGRESLIKIFERRDEFSHIKTIFLADKDAFVYSSVPPELDEIAWTDGYSIENDLYFNGFVERLLTVNEEVSFRVSLKNFIRYYAFELEKFNKKLVFNFSSHPNQVLNEKHELNEEYMKEINFQEPEDKTVEYLQNEYKKLLRGKSLFALLVRFLSCNGRQVKHNRKALYETCFKLAENNLINDLISTIQIRLAA